MIMHPLHLISQGANTKNIIMRKIYLKNFKGFKEAFFEMKDVNFFVGENSTGKTSILKLINILSDPRFWFNSEFNNDEVEFGYFEEIINKGITEKEFHIGMEAPFGKKKKQEAILLEFAEKDAIPIVKRIKLSLQSDDILISFKAKEIHYRVKERKDYEFDSWVKDFNFPKKFQKIQISPREIPLSLALTLIEGKIQHSDRDLSKGFGMQIRSFFNNYTWLAPIRAKAKRTYDSFKIKFSPEGEHIPSLLKDLLTKGSKTKNKELIQTLERFGKQSNLFDKIEINDLGKSKSSPFGINVLYNDVPIKLPNVGYGVSQVLPLIVEILSSTKQFISIQQPEVHLHPKAQSAFGEFIFDSFKTNNNQFAIETHSDFTINRFRYCLSKSRATKDLPTSQVIFFQRDIHGTNLTQLQINEKGEFVDKIPSSYRDFFIDEELKLLEL